MVTARLKTWLLTGLSVLVLATGVPNQAQADTVTFNFNCQVTPHAPGGVCVPGGSFGTVTLTDSIVDPNRVDISAQLTPGFGQTLERLLLNFTGTLPPQNKLVMVSQMAPAGSQGPTVGSAQICNNCQVLGQFDFDVRLSPQPPPNLTFSGSLALFDTNPPPDQEVNLDVSNFNVATVPTAASPGMPPLFAGYRTNVDTLGLGGKEGEFWAGTPGTPPSVSEPVSLFLLGAGLVGVASVAGRAAKRRAAGKLALAASAQGV
jgi:hypothetical protein